MLDPKVDISKILNAHGLEHFGMKSLQPALSFTHYKNWIHEGAQAGMEYLKKDLALKENPNHFLPKARSIISLTFSYFPELPGAEDFAFANNRVAYYARGDDYHFWLKDKLKKITEELGQIFPGEEFWAFTDSIPILERDYAAQNGLGWIGKNTCLIDRSKGSLFFIGEILTSLKIEASIDASQDHCGTCTRCIEACPTGALSAEQRRLDANLCISYWTIEAKEPAPIELRAKLGDWLFGCDICQEVCPWNKKIIAAAPTPPTPLSPEAHRKNLVQELQTIFNLSNRKLAKLIAKTPLNRAGAKGLKRNALILAANLKLLELKIDIEGCKFEDEKLKDLKQWTLDQLSLN